MPVTGEFIADFDDFVRGAKTAEQELDKLEGQGASVGASWQSAFSGVDIESAFSNPLSTATGLAKDFIGGIGSWGPIALGATAGIAALGTALIGLGNSSANTADDLGDLSDKTGMTVPELSKLSNAATLAGTTVDALADVSFQMQKRMAENPKDFADGLELLGINAKDFANAGAAEQVDMFSRALAAQEDPQKRIIAGQDVMGKQFKEMGPALMDLGGWALDAADGMGHVFTKEESDQAEEYHKQLGLAKLQFQQLADTIGSAVVPVLGFLAEKFNVVLGAIGTGLGAIKSTFGWVASGLEQIGLKSESALPPVKELSLVTMTHTATLKDFAASLNTASEAKERNKEITKELAAQEKAHEQASKDTQKQIAEAVKHYDDVTKEYEKILQRRYEHENAIAKSMTDLWTAYYEATTTESADATQRQIDNVWKHSHETELALIEAGKWTKEASDLIVATAEANEKKIRAAAVAAADEQKKQHKDTASSLQDLEGAADAATFAYGALQAAGASASGPEMQAAWRNMTAAQNDYADGLRESAFAMAEVAKQTAEATRASEDAERAMNRARSASMPGTYSASDTGFHQETRFGEQVLVSQGGEIVQRLEKLFGAGGFLGWGLPQGVTMQGLQIQLNGILMANDPAARQQLSDVISRTVTDQLKSQGVRLGSGV